MTRSSEQEKRSWRPDATRRALLSWFDRHRRDLPWRRSKDPYTIWVSEVMLQQTRVETATPYFERFMERFPTVQSLAAAAIDEVLTSWSGLGYYRRARQLHLAAQEIVRAGGEFPLNPTEWQRLPGVGAYTAAAVCSIAYGVAEPAIDGNVERVIARLLALEADPKAASGRKLIVAEARALVDSQRPGDSNQALMEIGAMICKPRAPRCATCPLRGACSAAARGEPERYPARKPRRAAEDIRRTVAVVTDEERILFIRRPEASKQMAGLWELPWVDAAPRSGAEQRFGERYGGRWSLVHRYGRVHHTVTHHRIRVDVWAARVEWGDVVTEGAEAAWFAAHEMETQPVSALVRKVLAAAE